MKYQQPKRLNISTLLLLGITLTSINHHDYVLAQKGKIVDPLCYWQTTDGRKIDLGVLCNSKSQQITLPLTNNQNLSIGKVTLTRNYDDDEYTIVGEIKNIGTIQKYIAVYYQTYNEVDAKIKATPTNPKLIDQGYLVPGDTAIFTIKLRRNFDLFRLRLRHSDYIQTRYAEIDICYGYSVEKQELCKRINPDKVRRFDKKSK